MKRLNTPAKYNAASPYVGYCQPCNKAIILCRKAARRIGRLTSLSKNGGEQSHRPRAYECPTTPGHWHVGHVPDAVRHGDITKEQWLDAKRTRS